MIAYQMWFDDVRWFLCNHEKCSVSLCKSTGQYVRPLEYANNAIDLNKMQILKDRLNGYTECVVDKETFKSIVEYGEIVTDIELVKLILDHMVDKSK